MATLITPDTISFTAKIGEDELRRRMADEVLQQIGGLDLDGKRLLGLKVEVRRGSSGGYTISVSGPAPARIFLPGAAP